jgi:hypothetical protein
MQVSELRRRHHAAGAAIVFLDDVARPAAAQDAGDAGGTVRDEMRGIGNPVLPGYLW